MVKELQILLEETEYEIINVNPGQEFLLRELFRGYKWNRIPLKQRLLLGTFFLDYVKNNDIGVEVLEKTSFKQQKYKKAKHKE